MHGGWARIEPPRTIKFTYGDDAAHRTSGVCLGAADASNDAGNGVLFADKSGSAFGAFTLWSTTSSSPGNCPHASASEMSAVELQGEERFTFIFPLNKISRRIFEEPAAWMGGKHAAQSEYFPQSRRCRATKCPGDNHHVKQQRVHERNIKKVKYGLGNDFPIASHFARMVGLPCEDQNFRSYGDVGKELAAPLDPNTLPGSAASLTG